MARSIRSHPGPAAVADPVVPGRLLVGTSGFAYRGWAPRFYPAGLAAKGYLPHYAGRLAAVELNNTYYGQPKPETVAAWLAFYVLAQSDPQARRLLGVYARRLNSNLVDALTQIAPRVDALRIAEGIAALIDGLYIRRALKDGPPDPASAIALLEDYVDTELTVLEARQ